MNNQYARQPHTPQGGGAANIVGRSGALLIDFDNVTLGAHGDLGRELQALLNSEVFRGKIAVRRAYGDWRRYPNYVVPLTEANIDLIFAPAWGSSKKNTTDLRMSVDAMELAFTRPEIGTFILLTGDSDFSSCVMKLKEYGKYVIGVGMRESASDLIVKNCDEYYSYHALTGLTRAAVGEGPTEDPWELIGRAARRMSEKGDSMRVDRLKQVMIDMDPGFDEREAGFGKFSKFAQRAAERGLIKLRRDDAGQFTVIPVGEDEMADAMASEPRRERDRDRDRVRGRGRSRGRERERGPRDDEPRILEPAESTEAEAPAARPEPTPRPEAAAPAGPAPRVEAAPELGAPSEAPAERPSRGRGRGRGRAEGPPPILPGQVAAASAPEAAAPEAAPVVEAAPVREAAPARESRPAASAPAGSGDPLRDAYGLLQAAVKDLTERRGERVRDGDIKRRMLEIQPGFDEGPLGFSKFTRFLRQAHDAGAVDLTRVAEGRYEASLPASGTRFAAPSGVAAAPPVRRPQPEEAAAPQAETAPAAEGRGRGRGRGRGAPEGPPPVIPGQAVGEQAPAAIETVQPAAETPRETERAPEPAAPAAVPAPRMGGRGGRGGRGMPSGPPPILPGQVVQIPGAASAASQPEPHQPAAAEPGEPAAAPAVPAESAAATLPGGREEIVQYLSAYRGVGRKMVEKLADTFGEGVFRALEEDPDAVRSLLGHRAAGLLEQWAADPNRAAAAPVPEVEAEPGAGGEGERPGRRSRGRRGGRGRGRARAEGVAQAEGAAGEDAGVAADTAVAMEPAAEVVETPAAAADRVLGDTDATLVPEVVGEDAGGARARSRRGRRGGRGRSRGEAGEAPVLEAKPERTERESSPQAAAPVREPRPPKRGRPAEVLAEAAPAPSPAPRKGAAKSAARPAAKKASPRKEPVAKRGAAAPAAPVPTPEVPAPRKRGRGPAMPAGEAPEPEAPAAAPAAPGRRRGGRGRGTGRSGPAGE